MNWRHTALPVSKSRSNNPRTSHFKFSDFLRRNTLFIPPISPKLIRLFGLVIALARRLVASADPVLVLGDTVTLLPGLELGFGLEPKYEDARRLFGVEDITVVVAVAVAAAGPWMMVGLPLLIARALPTMPSTQASLGEVVIAP